MPRVSGLGGMGAQTPSISWLVGWESGCPGSLAWGVGAWMLGVSSLGWGELVCPECLD